MPNLGQGISNLILDSISQDLISLDESWNQIISAERIYDEWPTHTLFTREYVLTHIIYSLHLYNMRTHTHTHH